MRIPLLLAFLLSSYLTFGQSVEYKISASLHYPFIPSVVELKESASAPQQMSGNPFSSFYNYYGTTTITKEITTTVFKSKAGINIGGIVAYSFSSRFSLETGLKLSLTRFESYASTERSSIKYCERNCNIYKKQEDVYAKDASGNTIVGVDGKPIPMRFYYPVADGQQQEVISSDAFNSTTEIVNSIIYIDFPFTAKYTVWNNLKLEGGFLTSLLVYSNQDVKRIAAGGKVDGRAFNKALLALRLAVSHPINQMVEIEAGYSRYLSGIHEPAPEASHPKYHFFNLGISYKIKN